MHFRPNPSAAIDGVARTVTFQQNMKVVRHHAKGDDSHPAVRFIPAHHSNKNLFFPRFQDKTSINNPRNTVIIRHPCLRFPPQSCSPHTLTYVHETQTALTNCLSPGLTGPFVPGPSKNCLSPPLPFSRASKTKRRSTIRETQ
jgi:hypothetical protein